MSKSSLKWAVVTGASSGLGTEFARALAARQWNVVLAARREEPMQVLATELRQQHGVQVAVESIDLSAPASSADLQKRLDARALHPDILINNGGFGLSGEFLSQEPARLAEMLQLDIVSLTELTHCFGKRMAERGTGHILLVASLAAYQPDPLLAAYGAAKHYVLALGVALHVELAGKVNVTVVSPGLMNTGFNEVSGFKPKASFKAIHRLVGKGGRSRPEGDVRRQIQRDRREAQSAYGISNRFTSRNLQAKLTYRMSK